MSELTYENQNGDTVFTSTFLRNRGTCCKTSCLHCPYGHTLKSMGLEFAPVTNETLDEAKLIVEAGTKKEETSLSASFLNEAFGAPKKEEPLTSENMDQFFFVLLKEQVAGVLKKGKQIYFKEHFKDQGLSLDIVGSYL